MDIQNHYYGHGHVMAAFAGLSRPRHIRGLVQHGWSPESPMTAHFGDFARMDPDRYLVFSHSSRIWLDCPEDRDRTRAIGAPWVYLTKMVGEVRAADGGAPLVFPHHGTRLIRLDADHEAYATAVADEYGPAVVCLHADDLSDPAIVRAWQSRGHSTVYAGDRRDPRFLLRIAGLVSEASVVVSNRISTPLFYAASWGVPVRVEGPRFHQASGSVASDALEARWPELVDPSSGLEDVRRIARAELGFEAALPPEGLRAALGWDARRAGPWLSYWVGSSLTKARNVLGSGSGRVVGSHTAVHGVSRRAWLRSPLSHLPDTLGPTIVPALERPLPVRE